MKRLITLAAVALLLSSCKGSTSLSDTLPDIYPDYIGVTVPGGIAPMDFNIPEEYDIVIIAVDNIATRTLVNDFCKKNMVL